MPVRPWMSRRKISLMHSTLSFKSYMNLPLIIPWATFCHFWNVRTLFSSKSANIRTRWSMLLPRDWPFCRSICLRRNKQVCYYLSSRYSASIQRLDLACLKLTKMRSAAALETTLLRTGPTSTTQPSLTQAKPTLYSNFSIHSINTRLHQAASTSN